MNEQPPGRVDVAIRGGMLFNGLGTSPSVTDIGLIGERVAEVGRVDKAPIEIDASGLAVCPGFIDVHAHDDYALFCEPDMRFKLGQGVSTVVIGNCGIGAFPFEPGLSHFTKYYPDAQPSRWSDFAGYVRAVNATEPVLNVVPLVAHGMIRQQTMGDSASRATRRELRAMSTMLADGLSSGAFGMSTGLAYDPGRSAGTAELLELTRIVADASGVYATHIRNEASDAAAALTEAIDLSRTVGVRLQISHLKVAGRENHGRASLLLACLAEARGAGLDVHHDAYPYTAVGTHLTALLRDARIDDVGVVKSHWGTFDARDLTVATCPNARELEGRSLQQLADEWGLGARRAAERLVDRAAGAAFVTVTLMNDVDVRQILEDDHAMVGSDGVPARGGVPHPRLYGTFPRVIGRLVRDSGALSMTEAIRRMTSLPAKAFGMEDRGVLVAGAYGDVLVFDPDQLIDVADYRSPRRLGPGVVHLFVNGTRAIANGEFVAERMGRVLARG